jgi:hypothetical protein
VRRNTFLPVYHYQQNYLQNSENLGQISFLIGEIFEEIKVVRFFLDKLYVPKFHLN